MAEYIENNAFERPKVNYHLALACLFLIINSLYYFLRFQFNLDQFVIASYLSLQLYISSVALLLLVNIGFGKVRASSIDFTCFILVFICLYLLVITFFRSPGLDSILYSFKDYLFPILFFFYCRRILKSARDWLIITRVLSITLSVVAFVYIFEFISTVYFGNEIFTYTQKIRELTILSIGGNLSDIDQGALSGSRELRDGRYVSLRLEGIMSHNNATGLAIALGLCASFFIAQISRSYFFYALTLLNIIALIFVASRTSIIALLSGLLFLWFLQKSSKDPTVYKVKKKTSMLKKLLVLLPFIFSFYWIVYESPLNFLFSFKSLLNALNAIFSNPELVTFLESLKQPLLMVGIGFPVPGNYSDTFNVIRSDDLYFIQLISIYGIPGIALFIFSGLKILKSFKRYLKTFPNEDKWVLNLGFLLLIVPFVTTLHAGSFGRPQIYPLVFLGLAALAYCFDRFYLNKNRK